MLVVGHERPLQVETGKPVHVFFPGIQVQGIKPPVYVLYELPAPQEWFTTHTGTSSHEEFFVEEVEVLFD